MENGQALEDIELPTPEPTGSQVLLEVTHCGVCHSDLHIWDGYYDIGGGKRLTLKDRGVTLPLAMGHEIVGRVVKLGPEASGVRVGDQRLVFPWLGCGVCKKCLSGEDSLCQKPSSIGIHRHGGYATHVVVPHARCLIDFGALDPAVAATYACSGLTAYGAILKVMPMDPDDPIVIVGAGGLGLNAIAILKALGHTRIVVVDISADKREGALAAGATDAVDGSGDDVTQRILQTCGGPVEAVIDLVNGTQTARFAFDALRRGGKLIQVGLFGGELSLRLPLMATRSLTVQGSYVGNPRDLHALVNLAKEGKVDPLPVTPMPRDHVNDALNRLRGGHVAGRIVLRAHAT